MRDIHSQSVQKKSNKNTNTHSKKYVENSDRESTNESSELESDDSSEESSTQSSNSSSSISTTKSSISNPRKRKISSTDKGNPKKKSKKGEKNDIPLQHSKSCDYYNQPKQAVVVIISKLANFYPAKNFKPMTCPQCVRECAFGGKMYVCFSCQIPICCNRKSKNCHSYGSKRLDIQKGL